jgi:hypothetical protein
MKLYNIVENIVSDKKRIILEQDLSSFEQYKTSKDYGYGEGVSPDMTASRKMAMSNAKIDFAKKNNLNQTTIGSHLPGSQEKAFDMSDGSVKFVVALKFKTTGDSQQSTGTTQNQQQTTPSIPTSNETPQQVYSRLVKDGALKGRLNGQRIVYKGGDLSNDTKNKLIEQLKSMGYELSRSNYDYKQGDKLVFKRK